MTKSNPLAASHHRGEQYLAAIMAVNPVAFLAPQPENRIPSPVMPTFSKHDHGGQIAASLGRKHNVDKYMIRDDGHFAVAVATIAKSWDHHALELILSGRACLSAKQVKTISRTHPERQWYEMNEVTHGRRPFRKPKSGTPPLDTLGYYEVKSRLERAAGSVHGVLWSMSHISDTRSLAERLSQLAAEIIVVSRNLLVLVEQVQIYSGAETPDGKKSNETGHVKAYEAKRLLGMLACARGLIEKSVRDIPRLPNFVRPNQGEKDRIQDLLKTIMTHTEALANGLAHV